MATYRRGRVNEAVRLELSSILREVKDPRITGAFVTITAADVAPDMKTARIYFSTLQDENLQEDGRRHALSPENKEVLHGLQSASGFLRRELAHRLNLRTTPELSFAFDDSMRQGAKINTILNRIEKERSDRTTDGETGSEETPAEE